MNRQLIDGVRVVMDDTSLLIWPDRKQAYFHLSVESEDKNKALELIREYREKIKEWQSP